MVGLGCTILLAEHLAADHLARHFGIDRRHHHVSLFVHAHRAESTDAAAGHSHRSASEPQRSCGRRCCSDRSRALTIYTQVQSSGSLTMRALLLSEYKKLSVVDMPTPEIGDDDVLVRVRACGICGSDIHGYDGSTGRRIPPLVMGHEAAGVIERVGRGVQGFAPGDRVSFDSTVSCGTCDFCRRGQINLCDNRTVLGVSCGDYRRHGAFAEYVAVPSRILYKLPDSLPFERAALIEAVSIAVHAVSRHVPKPDDTVGGRRSRDDRPAGHSGAQSQRRRRHRRRRCRPAEAGAAHDAWEPRAR